MSEIKYIHCFGTSHTEGGGFEFDSYSHLKNDLKHIYKYSGQELTRSNFSYPGQLSNILKDIGLDITVINHGKSGFGNQKMYRDTFNFVYDNHGNLNEHLFIYEFSWIGRREYYLKSINDYVVLNYFLDEKNNLTYDEIGHNYWYNSESELSKLESFKQTLIPFFNATCDETEIIKETERNNSFFYSFLKTSNLNFLLLNPPEAAVYLPEKESELLYGGYIHHTINLDMGSGLKCCFNELIDSKSYSITKETRNYIKDNHLGLVGNNLLAQNIYNTMVKNEYIKSNEIEVKKIKFPLNLDPSTFDKKSII